MKKSQFIIQLGHENEFANNILDIEFTPNKGDCLSVYGLARDLNSMLDMRLPKNIWKMLRIKLILLMMIIIFVQVFLLKIEIDNPPDTYKSYLESYFKRIKKSQNNFFTDVSNYLAYEIGQPTHCYEYEKIKNGIR